MGHRESITRTLDIKGQPHSWKIRVLGKLTKKQQDCLRLVLYYFEDMTVDDKEALVEGIELTMHDRYDHEMFIIKATSEKARISIRLTRIPDIDPVAASDVTEVEHGIH